MKILIFLLSVVCLSSISLETHAQPKHGIAMHGNPTLPAGFEHFPYANPNAPKGGNVVFGVLGSFDSLNPLIIRGRAAEGIRGFIYESLMARNFDEPFALYGRLAEKVETPEDRSWVSFTLNPKARFSDGTPVTIDDVAFTQNLLKLKGRPNHRSYYSKVVKTELRKPSTIIFHFDETGDREMPLIMGLMPILPKHLIDPETFEQTTLDIPVGSGPYSITKVDAGKSIVYTKDPDYWGADLPSNKGFFNFEKITYDYFRDENTIFEAFKKGLIHSRIEADPGRWKQAFDFEAVEDGRVIRAEVAHGLPSGMSGLVFNTRRWMFNDIKVRKALTHLFDAEWMNDNLYFGTYSRIRSYFDNSKLGSAGVAVTETEKSLLGENYDKLPKEFKDGSFKLPTSPGNGTNRKNRRMALKLLKEAGFQLKNGLMIQTNTGRTLEFEMLVANKDQERLAITFARDLRKNGIIMNVRNIDSAQYQRRLQTYDFDMISYRWYTSLSPGNEQNFFWGSKAASDEGARNYMGVKDPAIDSAISKLVAARERDEFEAAVRALDRLLLSGYYVIPLFYSPYQWIAHWQQIQRPAKASLYGSILDTWWYN